MLKYFLYFGLLITNLPGFFVNCGIFSKKHDSALPVTSGRRDIDLESSFTEEFRDINNRLIGKTHSCDAEFNMNIFEKMHQEDVAQKVNQSSRYVKAKKLILDLKNLLNKNTCNAQGHDIAVKYFLALDGKVFKKDKDLDYCFGRLNVIFVHYLERHSQICRGFYVDSLKCKLDEMDQEKVARVDYFAGNAIYQLMSKKKEENKSKSAGQRLMLVTDVHIDPRPKYILQRLRALAKGNRDEKALNSFKDKKTSMMMVDREKFKRLYNEYLVQPCQYYEDKLGPDVFEPVSFEREFHKVDEKNPDFYKAWGRYRLCVSFIREANEKLRETIDQAILYPNE